MQMRLLSFTSLVLALACFYAPAEARAQAAEVGARDEAVAAVPSPEAVARASLEEARVRGALELQQLQLRESQLQTALRNPSLTGPAVGLGLSTPAALVLLPLGTAMLAVAGDQYDYTDDGQFGSHVSNDRRARTRIIGGMLLGVGAAALVGVVYYAIRVRRIRQYRADVERQLEATHEQHGALLEWLAHPLSAPTWQTLP